MNRNIVVPVLLLFTAPGGILVSAIGLTAISLSGCGGGDLQGGGDGGDGGDSDGGDTDLSVGDLHAEGDAGGCGLRTCVSAGANCGPIGDGCGAIIQCGTCTAPTTCGGGGVPSKCGGTMGCVPKSCVSVGADCGPVADGCGGLLQCGACKNGAQCGAGKPNVCGASMSVPDGGGVDAGSGCVPTTCLKLGYNCGPAGDGCGGELACGACAMGEECGGNGKPSVCGPPNGGCVPRTCMQEGFNCGMAGDGCGGVINCNACTLPNICGGGGMPNVCGGGKIPDGGANNCDGGAVTTVSGVVYAPTNAAAGYGNPDPLPNAVVYIAGGPVMPFAAGVSCDQCGAGVSGNPIVSVITDYTGAFVLPDVPCGPQNMVIQIGRWRRQVPITVACCKNNVLTADQTRLPRNHTEGDIPLIAVSTGSADPIECVLPKIGIDPTEYSLPNGTGRVRFYVDTGANFGNNTPAASTLYNNPAELAKYDMVIFDCVSSQQNKMMAAQQNVINYANAGGRVFASHFSYVWLFNDAPFSGTAMWQVAQPDEPDLTGLVDQTFPKGLLFANWLEYVKASKVLGQIPVQQVRHDFNSVVAPSQRWIYSDPNVAKNNPIEYTFNTPVGAAPANQCGRILFSDFHVSTGGKGNGTFPAECNGASPMTPQEKVLEFMLFDLGSCIQPDQPVCTPLTCLAQKANCGAIGDGCGNIIQCGACPMGEVCGNGGPNQCGPSCVPLDCKSQGFDCGPAGDGCGNLIQCGACPMGESCGGAGPGKCGAVDMSLVCPPETCLSQGLECGPAGDGCGNQIDCGPCPMGKTCGGGGVPGMCGMGNCVPKTCIEANATCGFIGDGCGNAINCGTCPMGQTCGSAGTPNQCGGVA